MKFHLVPQHIRDQDAHRDMFGSSASRDETRLGYRLSSVVTLGGVILELTSANVDERESALGNKGNVSASLAAQLRYEGVKLIMLPRDNRC
ncbi:hypothetical protein [Roseiflexus castenholzii]|jgi:hypothetical protein|uniref:hypothetical protein n=1 Tax=Roseiflexus castenholzii TaxID=120962 RepID=UPI0012EE0387|nr:hypothetical protein [Roseiflexus castenholzii]